MTIEQKLQFAIALFTGLTSLGVIAAGISVMLLRRQIKADHDQRRRESALELIKMWAAESSHRTNESNYAAMLVDCLNKEQCEAVWNRQSFALDASQIEKLEPILSYAFPDVSLCISEGRIKLNAQQAAFLRIKAITFLNHLEAVCTAWLYHIADRTILENEFHPTISPSTNSLTLRTFRNITEFYPSIRAFEDDFRKRKLGPEGRPPAA